jgi:hypothetical protein
MGLSLLSQPIQAASITFSFDDSDNDLSIIVKNVDGIQLTMSNLTDGHIFFDTVATSCHNSRRSYVKASNS